jgi:hypothetical protein
MLGPVWRASMQFQQLLLVFYYMYSIQATDMMEITHGVVRHPINRVKR